MRLSTALVTESDLSCTYELKEVLNIIIFLSLSLFFFFVFFYIFGKIYRDEVNGHLEIVQDELEGLKDLLRSDVYSLDHNTLLGVSLPILNAHNDEEDDVEETNYEDANNLTTAGSKRISLNNENNNNDEDIEQTRFKILQFLNESLFNDLEE